MRKTSYVIENEHGVLGYTTHLDTAKRVGRSEGLVFLITKLIGPYLYEGFHAYYLFFDGVKYKRTYGRKPL